jgi:hypothetical protein
VSQPPWKSLVDQLIDQGHESEYLDRLRRSYDVRPEVRTSLEREILQEMAYALRRSEDKVNAALLALELAGKRCDASPTKKNVEAFNAQRDVALRARRDLMIHREALHFARDPRFEELYPVPPARRLP